MKQLRILVVGAGPAGLAAARLLSDHGSVRLVERRRAREAGGVGIYVPSNGVRMLDAMGLLDAVRDVSFPISRQEMRHATSGEVLGAADLTSVWPERWPCLAMRRRALIEVLGADLAVPVERGREVVGVRTAGDVVEVRFADGGEDEVDLLVAADGVSSAVRQAIWPDHSPLYAGESYWRGLVHRRPDWLRQWTGFVGQGRFLGVVPIGPEETYCFGFVLQDEPHDLPAEGDAMRRRFDDFADQGAALIDEIDPATLTFNHAWAVTLPTSVVGRCVLIGDAAHASSPSTAQGAALAFEDAVVLAAVVADDERRLDRYERARVDRVGYVSVTNRQRTEALKLPEAVRMEVLREFHSITERTFAPLQSDPRGAIPELDARLR